MALSALALALLLTAAPASAEDEEGTGGAGAGVQGEAGAHARVEAMGLPLVSYSSDFGIGYGAAGGMYIYAPGHSPYQHALGLQLYRTTRGMESHFLRYDGPGLLGSTRVEARLEYRRELRSPYFGVGNLAAPDFSGDLNDARVNYGRLNPSAWVRLRFHPLGQAHPFEPWVSYGLEAMRVHVLEGSILARERPVGTQGGWDGQLSAGAVWDTRDDEVRATRGGAEEVAVRLSSSATGSTYPYAGVTLVERRFWPLAPRLVLAQRVTLDALFGAVPFWELSNVGGLMGGEGLGGMSSLRGVPRNRYAGRTKLFSNSELRWEALAFRLFGQRLTAGGLAFVDVGRVWSPESEDGDVGAWHPGVGLGLRVARKAAVVRVDFGLSTETLRQGLYLTVGQMF